MTGYVDITLGPKYAVRISDMQSNDGMRLTCLACDHVGIIPVGVLLSRWPAYQRLQDIEAKFPCGKCGNQEGNSWQTVRFDPDF